MEKFITLKKHIISKNNKYSTNFISDMKLSFDGLTQKYDDFFEYIIQDESDNKLLDLLVDMFGEEYFKDNLDKISYSLQNITNDKIITILISLLNNKTMLKIISNKVSIDTKNKGEKYFNRNDFFPIIIMSSFKNNCDDNILTLFKIFLKDNKLNHHFFSWTVDILNDNITNTNIENVYEDKFYSDEFLLNIFNILLLIWNNLMTSNILNKINTNYIFDKKKCKIKWCNKKYFEDTSYLFSTKFFFLTINAFRIIYVSIITKIEFLKKDIKNIVEVLNVIKKKPSGIVSIFESLMLDGKLKIAKKKLDINKFLINTKIISINKIDNFIKDICGWIIKSNYVGELHNEIIWNIGKYLIHYDYSKKNSFNIVFDSKTIKYYDYVLNNSEIKDINIILDYLKLKTIYITNKTAINDGLILYELYSKIIMVHNKLDKKDNIFEEIDYKQILYRLIRLTKKNHNTDNLINISFLNNYEESIKFFNLIIEDINEMIILTNIQIKEKKNFKKSINIYENILLNLSIINELKEIKIEILKEDIIIKKISNLLNSIINMQILIKNNKSLWLNLSNFKKRIKLYSILLTMIIDLMDKFNSDKFIKNVRLNNFTYNYKTYIELKKYINKVFRNTDIVDEKKYINIINNFIEKLEVYENNTLENKEEYDLPEYYLDKLMYTEITEPILLPQTENYSEYEDMFMDKNVIMEHLMNSDTNPFNRKKLTKKELDEYNNREDVKEKIKKFREDLKNLKIKLKSHQ